MPEGKIRVLVVEDSPVARMLLLHVLSADTEIQVIGTAKNGREALQSVLQAAPDVVLMDIHMPEMDGFEATRRIMETRPTPIVICSASANLGEAMVGFQLLEAGALACVEKPVGPAQKNFELIAARLCQTVKLMSEVKVVRRWPRRDVPAAAKTLPMSIKPGPAAVEIIGIGASTGGPPVLQTILAALPRNFSTPILIVQHITPGFLKGLIEWLNQTSAVKVHVAAQGIPPEPGHAYVAPDNIHLAIRRDGMLALEQSDPERGLRPSVSHLFRSLAESYGPRAAGVLLTGMGKDGALELKLMRDRGAITIVQDRDTSVIYGMPGEAVALGAACHVLPADRIAGALAMLAHP